MDVPARTEAEAPEVAAPPEYCDYCGARIHLRYYFCLRCATPYTTVGSVLKPLRPERLTDGELVEKKAPQAPRLFWSFFATVVGASLLAYLLFDEDRPGLGLIFRTVAVCVTTCVFAVAYWPSLVVQLKRFGFGHPAVVVALLALAPVLGISYVYHHWLIETLGVERALPLERLREAGLGHSALVFFFCVLPAITEEIAFRGLLQHWLQVAIRPWRALVLASALFTALHFSILSAPCLFGLGLLLGWTKWKTGSLYPSMLIHFLHNWIVLDLFAL